MKRCPECSFIYEDEQCICDMDGQALVHDPRPIPKRKRNAAKVAKLSSRSFVVTAIVGIALVALLFTVYYFLKHRDPVQNNNPPAPTTRQSSTQSTTAKETAPTAVVESQVAALTPPMPSPSSTTVPRTKGSQAARNTDDTTTTSTNKRQAIDRRTTPLPSVTPLPRLADPEPDEKDSYSASTPARTVAAKQKPAITSRERASVGNKKESRVTSLLKKTGRVLAKPFRF